MDMIMNSGSHDRSKPRFIFVILNPILPERLSGRLMLHSGGAAGHDIEDCTLAPDIHKQIARPE
jgi:hypothetical protein